MQQESAKPAAARPEPSPAPQASRWLEQAITAASDSRGLEAPQERALWLIEQVNAAAAALAKAEEPVRSISLETAEPAAVASTQPAATSQLPSQPPPTSAAPLTTAALPAPVEAQAPVPLPSPDVQTEASPPAASEPDQATIGELDKAIARNPGNPDLLLRRASLFSTRGLLARALADYDAAIAIDDRRSRALHGRGLLLVRMGDIDRGLADLDHAIRLSFADPKIYKDRGAIWFHKGSYDRAIADFDRAISLAPDFASAHFYRALALREKGDAAGAAASLAEAARLDPTLAGLVRRMPAPNAVTGSAGR